METEISFTGLKPQIVQSISVKKNLAKKVNQSIFSGVDKYIESAYGQKRLKKPQIAGCTSSIGIYRQQSLPKNLSNSQDRFHSTSKLIRGRLPVRFSQEIQSSNEVLIKARRGISIFASKDFRESVNQKSLPFLESQSVKQDLQHYLNLSVAKQTFSKELPQDKKLQIVQLIESSPDTNSNQKHNQQILKSVSSHKLQKKNLQQNYALKIEDQQPLLVVKKKSLKQKQDELDRQIQAIAKVEQKLSEELIRYEEKFNYPINPAFLHPSQMSKPLQNLKKFNTYCVKNGITSTQLQHDVINRHKRNIEYEFWQKGLQGTLKGYSDKEFEQLFVQFINELHFGYMSDTQKKLLFSHALYFNNITRQAQLFIRDWLKKFEREQAARDAKNTRYQATNTSEFYQEQSQVVQRLCQLKDVAVVMNKPLTPQEQQELENNVISEQAIIFEKIKQKMFEAEVSSEVKLQQTSESEDDSKLSEMSHENKFQFLESRAINFLRKIHILQQNTKQDLTTLEQEKIKRKLEQYQKRVDKLCVKIRSFSEKQKLVQNHEAYFSSLKQKLGRLDMQTNQITQGDISPLIHNKNLYIFSPNHDYQKMKSGEPSPRPDDTGYPSHSPQHAILLEECFDSHNKPIANLIHTSEKIKRHNYALDIKMERMLDRVKLDRNLLIKEKINCILGQNQDTTILNKQLKDQQQPMTLSEQLNLNKLERSKTNVVQVEAYQKALIYLVNRIKNEVKLCELQEEEIKLINLVRVILQGGWSIDTIVLTEIMQLAGIEQCQKRYLEFLEERKKGSNQLVNERDLTVLKTSWWLSNVLGFADFIHLDQLHLPKIYPTNLPKNNKKNIEKKSEDLQGQLNLGH